MDDQRANAHRSQPDFNTADIPLSTAQLAMVYLLHAEPESSAYHLGMPIAIRQRLDIETLREAWRMLSDRHPIISSRLVTSDDGYLLRYGDIVPVIDEADVDDVWAADVRQEVQLGYDRPFDLEVEAPARLYVRRDSKNSAIVVVVHHIAGDLTSSFVLITDLLRCYSELAIGRQPEPNAGPSFADFVSEERRMLTSDRARSHREYWRHALDGCQFRLELPTGSEAPSRADGATTYALFRLDTTQRAAIERVADSAGASTALVLLAAFYRLLHDVSGHNDIVIGFPTRGRKKRFADTVGYFSNPLLLRVIVDPSQPFADLVKRVYHSFASAVRHQVLPTAAVLAGSDTRNSSGTSLYQVSFQFEPIEISVGTLLVFGSERPVSSLFGFDIYAYPIRQQVGQFPMRVQIGDMGDELLGGLHFDPNVLTYAQAAEYARRYVELVTELGAEIDHSDRTKLVPVTQHMEPASRPSSVHDVLDAFDEQASEHGDTTAVITSESTWTYGDVYHTSITLAYELREAGVSVGDVVGLYLPRDERAIISMLAVLRTGAMWIALDPTNPMPRTIQTLERAGCSIIVTDARTGDLLPAKMNIPNINLDSIVGQVRLHEQREDFFRPAHTAADGAYIVSTSGSSGIPKMVMVSRGQLAVSTASRREYYGAQSPIFLLLSPLPFDSSLAGIWWTLTTGGSLVIPTGKEGADTVALATMICKYQISHLLTVPSLYRVLLEQLDSTTSLQTVVVAGETCPPALVNGHMTTLHDVALVNEYGPSECTVWATAHRCEEVDREAVPIGRAIPGTACYILDGQMQVVARGGSGELYLGGHAVADGYRGAPGLTAERYLPDPFDPRPGSRMYRTGDHVRFRDDGMLVFRGRLDEQVKIRGFRVEPAEVAEVLSRDGRIARCAVVAKRPPGETDLRLVAYVVPAIDGGVTKEVISRLATSQLPAHLVPSAYVICDQLPELPNGKIDHKALALPDWSSERPPYRAPRNETERLLVDIWERTLGHTGIGIDDDYLELGGDSIIAIQIVARLRHAGRRLRPTDIPRGRSIAQLAELVYEDNPPVSSEDSVDDGDVPLTPMQHGILYHCLSEADDDVYIEQLVLRIAGSLDSTTLAAAWQQVIDRHPALRAHIAWDDSGSPSLRISSRVDLPVRELDLREIDADLDEWLSSDRRRGFELDAAPLSRLAVIQTGDKEHVVVWTHHHLIVDGWSLPIICNEVFRAYGGQLLPPASDGYRQFLRWRASQDDAVARQHWRSELAGVDGPTLLTNVLPPAVGGGVSTRVFREKLRLDLAASRMLRDSARALDTTPAVLIHAAWLLTVATYTGNDNVIVGHVVSGRQGDHEDIDEIVGLFINTLPLVGRHLHTAEVADFLAAVDRTMFTAREYEHAPLPMITADCGFDPGSPLFDSVVIVENYPMNPARTQLPDELRVEEARVDERTNYPIIVQAFDADEVAIDLLCDPAHVDQGAAAALLATMRRALEFLSGDGARSLSQFEISPGSGPRFEAASPTAVVDSFCNNAARDPWAPAVVDSSGEWAYNDIDRASAALALMIVARKTSHGIIGLCLPRSAATAVGMLAALRAGYGWLTLDPSHPLQRSIESASAVSCDYLICNDQTSELAAEIAARVATSEIEVINIDAVGGVHSLVAAGFRDAQNTTNNDDMAYVVFTSGSTSIPKGVAVSGTQLASHLHAAASVFELSASDRVLVFGSFAFDVAIEQLLAPLTVGACAVIRPDGLLDADGLFEFMAENEVTVFNPPTGVWRSMRDGIALMRRSERLQQLRLTIVGGDTMPSAEVHSWLELVGGRLLNAYGPTEGVITATTYEVSGSEKSGVVPIGLPLPGRRVHILDQSMHSVADGAIGELCLGGAVLSYGYAGDPAATADRFRPDSHGPAGSRLYLTGDLASRTGDGPLRFHGRNDDQLKIRGHRIEPAEVAAVMREQPGVSEAVVVAKEAVVGKELVGYVIAEADWVEARGLRAAVGQRLPAYMVPRQVVVLERLPLTDNGKVDYAALPQVRAPMAPSESVEPRTELERQLIAIWRDVFNRSDVGVHDDYFDLGGDSILSIQISSRAQRAGISLRPWQLLNHPTIAELASINGYVAPSDQLSPANVPNPIQQWFFDLAASADWNPAHWNMSVMLALEIDFSEDVLRDGLGKLIECHEALRTKFVEDAEGYIKLVVTEPYVADLTVIDLTGSAAEDICEEFIRRCHHLQSGFNLEAGSVFTAAVGRTDRGRDDLLLLIAHHLVIDAVSWRILVGELADLLVDPTMELPAEDTTAREWTTLLLQRAGRPAADASRLPRRRQLDAGTEGQAISRASEMDVDATWRLRQNLKRRLGITIDEALTACALSAYARLCNRSEVVLELEGHGRHDLAAEEDLSRTIGWFTTLAPIELDVAHGEPLATVWQLRHGLEGMPYGGLDYGIDRYLGDGSKSRDVAVDINVNYLGRIGTQSEAGPLRLISGRCGQVRDPAAPRACSVVVEGSLLDDKMSVVVEHTDADFVDKLSKAITTELAILAGLEGPRVVGGVPNQLADSRTVQKLAKIHGDLTTIWPMTVAQQSMMFRSLSESKNGTYVEQLTVKISGALDPEVFGQAWQQLARRHAMLRARAEWRDVARPVLVVPAVGDVPYRVVDMRSGGTDAVTELVNSDRQVGFELSGGPLIRVSLLRTSDDSWTFLMSHHHLLLDGWSLTIVLRELMQFYESALKGSDVGLPPPGDYSRIVAWMENCDTEIARRYWEDRLAGYTDPALLNPTVVAAGEHRDLNGCVGERATAALASTAADMGVTVASIVNAGWLLLVAHRSQRRDVAIGSVEWGRPAELAECESAVGMTITTLPIRVQMDSGASIDDWLDMTYRTLQADRQYPHVDIPAVAAGIGLGGQRLFDSAVIVNNHQFATFASDVAGLTIGDAVAHEQTELPVTLTAVLGQELNLTVNHDMAVLDAGGAADLLDDYITVLRWMCKPMSSIGDVMAELDRRTGQRRNDRRGRLVAAQRQYRQPLAANLDITRSRLRKSEES